MPNQSISEVAAWTSPKGTKRDPPRNLPPELANEISRELCRVRSQRRFGATFEACLQNAYDACAGVLTDAGKALDDNLLTEVIPAWVLRWAVIQQLYIPLPENEMVVIGDVRVGDTTKADVLMRLGCRILHWQAISLRQRTKEPERSGEHTTDGLSAGSHEAQSRDRSSPEKMISDDRMDPGTLPEEPPLTPQQTWENIEIRFTSDERIQVQNGPNNPTYNYGDLGFEDRRTGAPNKAWITLRGLAEQSGILKDGASTQQDWPKVEKRIQEIRKALRREFRISADPIPFDPGIGYRTKFRISCSTSFKS